MPTEIVLLTSQSEGKQLSNALTTVNPALRVSVAVDQADLEAMCLQNLEPERRLIAFCTGVIVPERILNAVSKPAYNFHPGPPTFPGSRSASFALYEGADRFGATLHEMTTKVDEGPIVEVEWFPMPPKARIDQLEIETYNSLARLFFRHAAHLALDDRPLPVSDVLWSGPKRTKAEAEALQQLSETASEEEVRRIVRAFG